MTCTHHNGKGCTLGLYGGRPSAGVCSRCDKYDGPLRGLGDVVHTVLTYTGAGAVAKAIAPNCKCTERRARLNAALPIGEQRWL